MGVAVQSSVSRLRANTLAVSLALILNEQHTDATGCQQVLGMACQPADKDVNIALRVVQTGCVTGIGQTLPIGGGEHHTAQRAAQGTHFALQFFALGGGRVVHA